MKIVKSFVTKNPCYTVGRKITVKGLMLHSVGCPQPKATVFVKQFNKTTYTRACVHAFIDANDGIVHQTLPWNYRAIHAGGSANNTHIGVEMCEPSYIKYTGGATFTITNKEKAVAQAKTAYISAVELFAKLCKDYNLNPLTDICSHKEGHKKGIASNHGDPEHLWKGLGLPYTMDTFRNDVKSKMGTPNVTFVVRVDIDNLNIRSGAGLSYPTKGKCPKGVYTIVETKTANGYEWGKLKSGVGWIALGYTKRV